MLTDPDSGEDASSWCAGGESGVLDTVFGRWLFEVFELSLAVLGSCLVDYVRME